jgi:hypothetical protein
MNLLAVIHVNGTAPASLEAQVCFSIHYSRRDTSITLAFSPESRLELVDGECLFNVEERNGNREEVFVANNFS